MGFKIVVLWTDWALYLLLALLAAYVWRVRGRADMRKSWLRVMSQPVALSCAVLLAVLLAVAALDSLHFRQQLPQRMGGAPAYGTKTLSVLDLAIKPLIDSREDTYSAPLAAYGFVKQPVPERPAGAPREFPRLKHGGAHLRDVQGEWAQDVALRVGMGAAAGGLICLLLWGVAVWWRRGGVEDGAATDNAGPAKVQWHAALFTLGVLVMVAAIAASLARGYHVLGTDRTGNDILYMELKSIRTAFVIGGLTVLTSLPFALGLGLMAGYFKGWVDEAIQYGYTVLSSVPSILLIAACALMVQVFIDKHPDLYETGLERADLKLFLLCMILGVTGWAGLCRLVRAETMKLRELEYVQAAVAFGVGPWRIMRRHLAPNVMHLVLITTVLDFSGMILAEAVLSYVGVGVDASMNSFGVMINQARIEMSREPVVWWSLASTFVFMVSIVLAANLFADAVRDAFDPRGARSSLRKAKGAPAPAVEAPHG